MLEIRNLNAGYDGFQVLFDVSTRIQKREIAVIVGPNGSGKSTLLKSVFGLTKIYSGKILFEGEDIVGYSPHEIARRSIAYLPQVDNLFPGLTVRENLLMAGYVLSEEEVSDRTEEALNFFPVLKEFYGRRADTLSGGERQMLAMAMSLIREPRLMMFDEPTANLAPKIAIQVLEKITSLRDEYGMTIVIAEQSAGRTLEQGEKALLLVGGQVVFDGKAEDLLSNKELGKLYLGIKPVSPLKRRMKRIFGKRSRTF